MSCQLLPWSCFWFCNSCEVILVWVSHRVSEWRAGFINLRQPWTHEFEGHLSLLSVTYAHAGRSVSISILTFHPGGHWSAKTALHHEVLLPTALHPVVGVPRIFGSHHRGLWEGLSVWRRHVLCSELVDPQPAYVHAHGPERRRLSPYEPQGEIVDRCSLLSSHLWSIPRQWFVSIQWCHGSDAV